MKDDDDNDNEGFELSKETFEVLLPSPITTSKIVKKNTITRIKEMNESSLNAPFSTFFSIKNYKTPEEINDSYSLETINLKVIGDNQAWSASE